MTNNLDNLVSRDTPREVPFNTEFPETNEVLEQHDDDEIKYLGKYNFNWEFIKKLTPDMVKNLLNSAKKVDSKNSNTKSEIKFETEQVNMMFDAIALELVRDLINDETYKDNEEITKLMETGFTLDGLKEIDSNTTDAIINKMLNLFKEKFLKEKIQILQGEIEETNTKKDWKELRNSIKYDRKTNKVISRGNETEVESIDVYNDKITLKGLNLGREFTLNEGLRLANLRNWIKYEYGDGKVGFGNSPFHLRYTLTACDATILISRKNLKKHIPLLKYNENMETLIQWLNK